MRIISQNVTNYGFDVPSNTIFRINLAWCDSINDLESILQKNLDNDIFLDLPTKRVKPPNNRYQIEDLVSIIESYKQIKYFAISNVDSGEDLKKYVDILPTNLILVPKIESPKAVNNISEIVTTIPTDKKIVMLDHDDLFSKLVKNNETQNFQQYIQKLVKFTNENNVILLRTVGVIFSDDEKRTSNYVR